MNKICAIIPARAGSKGVLNKNIKNLGGHSLLEWSINACKKSRFIDQIIVSTDSQNYAEHSLSIGAEVPFLRPKEISQDYSTDYEFISHAIDWFKENQNVPTYLIHIRPTTPIRDPELMDKAIDLFIRNETATSLRSVHKMSESAYKSFEISSNGFLKLLGSDSLELDSANLPRQKFIDTFTPNGYIDVLSVSYIIKNRKIHGNRVIPYCTPHTYEIDTEEDFKYLDHFIQLNPFLVKSLFD